MSTETRKEKSARSRSKKQERKFAAESAIATQELADKLMQDANKSAQEAAASFGGGNGVNFNAAPTNVERASEKLRNEANAPKAINVGTPVLPALRATNENTVKSEIPSVSVPGGVSVETPSTATIEKPKSFADVLADRYAEMRKTAEKEKTDAAKMQKYYALTDALRAIGQLGGTAVGGAIGGDLPDSAPAVDPYKESRGYLDAFERAKKANDRIKELDEKGFQLALRDEERDYNAKAKEAENAYKAKMDAADKAWQIDFYNLRAEKEKAIAEGNLKLKAELDAKEAAKQQEYLKERMAIQQQYERELKALSERIVRIQMGEDVDGTGKKLGKTTPFTFHNGSKIDIPQSLYPEMLKFFASKGKIGEEVVDEENIESVLRNHPDMVNGFLRIYGLGEEIPVEETIVEETIEEEETPKTAWRPDPNKFYGYGFGYLPSQPKSKKGNDGNTETTTEAESKWANKKTGRKS